MIELLVQAKQHFADKLPFVVYVKPNQDKLIALFQQDDTLHYTEKLEETGFVLAPFKEGKRLLIPESRSNVRVAGVVLEENYISKDSIANDEKGKEAFEHLVQQGIDAIEQQEFEKVVLSRKEIVTVEDLDFTAIFKNMVQVYPAAFRYCWFHPKIGMWMGATPEQLLMADGRRISTVALAGTQKYEEGKEAIWEQKEIEEQRFVTDFIVEHLQDITSGLTVSEPYTVRAGSILHIKTDIEALLKEGHHLQQVVSILHPTPAVCGMPKAAAQEFILRKEGYERQYYSGFLGELNKDFAADAEKSDLFVNLRCMQIKDNQAHLYIGCGITKDSVPEKEFIETVNKSVTMKRILV